MADTYSALLRLTLPGDDDESWGDDHRESMAKLELAVMPQSSTYPIFIVNPGFSTANFPGIDVAAGRRFFDTIQGAIDAVSAGTFTTIFVYPQVYFEAISIPAGRYITFVALPRSGYAHTGGKVSLRGAGASVSDPVITIDAHNSAYTRVEFAGFKLDNAYNGSGATVNDAMICKVVKGGNYTSGHAVVLFRDCIVRGQTWGGDDWKTLFWVDGVGDLIFHLRDCCIGGFNYLGGVTRSLLRLEGDQTANSKSIVSRLFDCRLAMSTDPTSYDGEIYGNDGLSLAALRCVFDEDFADGSVYKDGGTGSVVFAGLESDSARYQNIENLSFVFTG